MAQIIPMKYLIIHHTGGTEDNSLADTSSHTFEQVNAWHRQNPNVWLGRLSSLGYAIGYQYFIDKTGKVTQGRADNEEGAHTIGHNKDSIGICLAGNFDVTFPTQEQRNTLRELLIRKQKEYGILTKNILPHSHFWKTHCYGRNLNDTWAQELVETKDVPPELNMCLIQVSELKKQVAWYEVILSKFFKRP